MGALLFLRLLPLFSLLTLLQFPSESFALSITCEHSGAPIFIPLTADFTLKCTYETQYPIIAVRLDGPPGRALAQVVITINHATSEVPGLAISAAENNSVILSFKNITEARYRSDYVLTIINHAFQQYQEKIDLRRAEAPVISLGTDNVDTGFVDWAKVTIYLIDVKRPKISICFKQKSGIINTGN